MSSKIHPDVGLDLEYQQQHKAFVNHFGKLGAEKVDLPPWQYSSLGTNVTLLRPAEDSSIVV